MADNARIPKDVRQRDRRLHAACGTLLNDAEMANTELPSPDPTVTDLLTKAYGLEGTAANDCYDAGATNTKLLAKSERDAIKAEALYGEALQRIRADRRPGARRRRRRPDNSAAASSDDGGSFGSSGTATTTSSTATAAGCSGRCRPASTSSAAGTATRST